jgi:hypothetical protein
MGNVPSGEGVVEGGSDSDAVRKIFKIELHI